MSDYDARMRAIEQADAERRLLREIAELEAIATRKVDPYHWARSITGAPSNGNRQYRASDDCWKKGLSNPQRGYTRTTVTDEIVPDTVRVIKDGTDRIVPVSSFRAERVHTKQRAHRTTVVASEQHVATRGRDIAIHATMGTNHIAQ